MTEPFNDEPPAAPSGGRGKTIAIVATILVVFAGIGYGVSKWNQHRRDEQAAERTRELLSVLTAGAGRHDLDLDIVTCDSTHVFGWITNNGVTEVDVTLRYELLNDSGVRLDDGLVFVDGLDAGQKAAWRDDFFGRKSYDRCSVEIEAVYDS